MRYHLWTLDIIREAGREARELGHSCVGSEHILLSLSRDPGGAGRVLRTLGVEPETAVALAETV